MQMAELAVLDWIQAHLRCRLLDVLMPAISWTCNHGELWILLALCLLAVKKYRRQGCTVVLAHRRFWHGNHLCRDLFVQPFSLSG